MPADAARMASETKEKALENYGITVWEQGNLIEVPRNTRGSTMHLWTVVRVL